MSAPHGLKTGPIAWAAIIGSTCLSVFLLQKILWLVVPALLALVLYYLLFSPVQWLMYRGLSRQGASGLAMGGFLVLSGGYLTFLFPWIGAHLEDWQASVARYLNGGLSLLERSLASLERSSAFLADAHLKDLATARVADMLNDATQYVEPAVMGAASWAPTLLLAPFLAYFFLRDGGRFQRLLGQAVPNAFFEKTLFLLHEVDRTARAYFQGMLWLTLLDTLTLALGLWWLGLPSPLGLGLVCAILAWLPFVGSVLGGLLVVLVAATDFPAAPAMAYGAVGLFLLARLLDDFVYMPLTVGKSLHLHPLVTVLMIFIGGAVAGVAGLMLVLPLLGVIMVVGDTLGRILDDARLLARYRHGRQLRQRRVSVDLR